MQFSLIELWHHMGLGARLITCTMLAMSLASIIVAFERVMVLVASNKQSIAFARRLSELLVDGDVDKAANAQLGAAQGHLGRVLTAALSTYRSCPKGDSDFTLDAVARVLERQAQREVHNMKRGIGVLANVASTAPFVGLLGTVLGIVNAFQMMAETGSGGLSTVSAGIAEALATTALGLLVAIPAMGTYNGLTSWIEGRAVDIAEASNELLDLLARQLKRGARPEGAREPMATVRTRASAAAER
jgi:biopolymer transport protein ExbB/biopolymer transport protein TolQ